MVPRKSLTVAEAAESLGVSSATIRVQIAHYRNTDGRIGLRARKLGGENRIDPTDLETYRADRLGKPGRPKKPKEDPT